VVGVSGSVVIAEHLILVVEEEEEEEEEEVEVVVVVVVDVDLTFHAETSLVCRSCL